MTTPNTLTPTTQFPTRREARAGYANSEIGFVSEVPIEGEIVDDYMAPNSQEIAQLLRPIPEYLIENDTDQNVRVHQRLDDARSGSAELIPVIQNNTFDILQRTASERLAAGGAFEARETQLTDSYQLALADLHAQYRRAVEAESWKQQIALKNLNSMDTLAEKAKSLYQVVMSLHNHDIATAEAHQARHETDRDDALDTITRLIALHVKLVVAIDDATQRREQSTEDLSESYLAKDEVNKDILSEKVKEVKERKMLTDPDIIDLTNRFGHEGPGVEEGKAAIRLAAHSKTLDDIMMRIARLDELWQTNERTITIYSNQIDSNNLAIATAQTELDEIPELLIAARAKLTDELTVAAPELDQKSDTIVSLTKKLKLFVDDDTTANKTVVIPPTWQLLCDTLAELSHMKNTLTSDYMTDYIPPVFELAPSLLLPFTKDLTQEGSLAPGVQVGRRNAVYLKQQALIENTDVIKLAGRGILTVGKFVTMKLNNSSSKESR